MTRTSIRTSRAALALLALILTPTAFAKKTLYRPSAFTLELKSKEIDILGSFLTTSSYYDVEGNEVEQGENDSFSRQDFDISFGYGLTREIELRAGGRYRNQSSETATETRSASGLESIFIGAKYGLAPVRSWKFAVSGEARYSPYTPEDYTSTSEYPADEMELGDGGPEITLKGHTSYHLSGNWYLSGELGYRIPGNSLSHEIVYDAELAYSGESWLLTGGFTGIKSMNGSEYSDTPASKPLQNTGTTALYNSVDRERMSLVGAVGYAWNPNWLIRVGGEQVLSGRSTDNYQALTLGVTWNSSGVSREEQKISTFKEYHVEATVIKVSPRGAFIKIDKGLSQDVEKGMPFDIYKSDYFGGNELVATGVVYESQSDTAIVKLTKKYKQIPVVKGFIARGR